MSKIHEIIPNIIFYALLTADETPVIVVQIDKISDLRASLSQTKASTLTTWENIIAAASHAQNSLRMYDPLPSI